MIIFMRCMERPHEPRRTARFVRSISLTLKRSCTFGEISCERQAIEMIQPPKNAPFLNDFALRILTLLRRGGVSLAELAEEFNPRPGRKVLSTHLERLEYLQLVVRDSTGPTGLWWIDADVMLPMSDRVARCAEGLTQLDKAFVRSLSREIKEVLPRRKLFSYPERIFILQELAQAPRGVDYFWKKLNATISKREL